MTRARAKGPPLPPVGDALRERISTIPFRRMKIDFWYAFKIIFLPGAMRRFTASDWTSRGAERALFGFHTGSYQKPNFLTIKAFQLQKTEAHRTAGGSLAGSIPAIGAPGARTSALNTKITRNVTKRL
jgi:hypothetical protein